MQGSDVSDNPKYTHLLSKIRIFYIGDEDVTFIKIFMMRRSKIKRNESFL